MLRQHGGRFGCANFGECAVWGMAAAVAMIIAVFAGSTDAGVDRARHAALQLREVVMPSGIKPARPLDAIEGRKLAETVRVLTDDRERLLARIAALEHNVDDITSSISQRREDGAAGAAAAEPSPPTTMSAQPRRADVPHRRAREPPSPRPPRPPSRPCRSRRAAAEDDVVSSVGKPEAPSSESETPAAPAHAPRQPGDQTAVRPRSGRRGFGGRLAHALGQRAAPSQSFGPQSAADGADPRRIRAAARSTA